MALAERYLRETFGGELCDHWTYAIVSDGDLMEGVAHEAASLAGHLGLGRLVYLYDDNEITIDGGTDLSFTEDVLARMQACGWHVQRVDGHDREAIEAAIEAAREETQRPSIISCRTVIGFGSPSYAGTSRTHGAPLGEDEIAKTKVALGMDPELHFHVPDGVYAAFSQHDGSTRHKAWRERFSAHPDAARFQSWLDGDVDAVIENASWPSFETGSSLATRKASAACLKALTKEAPWLMGGSADLSGSNGVVTGQDTLQRDRFSNAAQINFGVREHGMAAVCNGIMLHGGLRPYNATFLVFHDYHRPSVRLSALMNLPVIYIYSHDSIFLGEDGPTHQPITTLLTLRALPGNEVWRPADARETKVAWCEALRRKDAPTALILSRQGLPIMPATEDPSLPARGGYVVGESVATPDICLMGTGSEVATCVSAQKLLAQQGIQARVVSLPCRERFLDQAEAYRDSVMPPGVPRISVEAGSTLGWERWVGERGVIVGIDTFGASAPASVLAEKFGFTGAQVAARAAELLQSQ